jgi:hypothetical protein
VYLYTHIIGVFFLPTINVPGIGEVFADGFAEEQTMSRILAVLQSSDNANSPEALQRLSAAANTGSSSIFNFGKKTQKAGDDTSQGSSKVVQGLSAAGAAATSYGRTMRQATQGVVRSFGDVQKQPFALAQSLTNLVLKAGESILKGGFFGKIVGGAMGAGITKMFSDNPAAIFGGGAIGALLGDKMVPIASAITGFLFEKLNSTSQAFFDVQRSGALLGGSLIDFRNFAHKANLTMGEFTNIFKNNGEAMASFGGQTNRGAREFSRATSAVMENNRELRTLGFSFEDIGMATADFMENLALSGVAINRSAVNTSQFADAVATSIRQQKIVATLTGRSIEQQKQAERAQRKDAQVQAAIARLGPAQRDEIQRLISAFPQMRSVILDQVTFGQTISKDALMISGVLPTMTAGIEDATQGILNNTGMTSSAFQNFASNNQAMRSEFLNSTDMVAQLGRFTNNTFVKTAQDSVIMAQQATASAINKTINDVLDDFTKLQSGTNTATNALIELQDNNRKLALTLSKLTTEMLRNSSGVVNFISELTAGLNTGVIKIANFLGLEPGQTRVGPYNRELQTQFSDFAATAGRSTDASTGTTQNLTTGAVTPPQTTTKTIDVNAPVLQRQIDELTKVMKGTNNKMDSLSTVLT